jgi:hypothetical protein
MAKAVRATDITNSGLVMVLLYQRMLRCWRVWNRVTRLDEFLPIEGLFTLGSFQIKEVAHIFELLKFMDLF